MRILLTNDDGVMAPGLAALQRALVQLGQVEVVAPATEKSGVSHSITFLTPIFCKRVTNSVGPAWAVEGTPADCVKIAVSEICNERPDLIVSGINGGLNAGINILYSGTVGAAFEGAFFEIDSIAVSLESSQVANFDAAAEIAVQVIRHLLAKHAEDNHRSPQMYNLNIPTVVADGTWDETLQVVPMGRERYGSHFEKRVDPKGRTYYWASGKPNPKPSKHETDLTALRAGHVTLTPIRYDVTSHDVLAEMKQWEWKSSKA